MKNLRIENFGLILVFLGLLATVFTQHWAYDEGWNVLIAREFNENGRMVILLQLKDLRLVFLKPLIFYVAMAIRVFGVQAYWADRMLSFAFSLGGLYFLESLQRKRGVHPWARIVSSLLLVLLFQHISFGLISVRAEMVYFFSISLAVYALESVGRTPSYWLAASWVAILLLPFHPNVALTGVPLAAGAWPAFKRIKAYATWKSMVSILAGYIIACIIAAMVLRYGFASFKEMFAALNTLASGPSHNPGFSLEQIRYKQLIETSPLAASLVFTGLFGVGLMIFFKDLFLRRCSIAAIGILVALSLAGAKWTYYFAAVLPFLGIAYGQYAGVAFQKIKKPTQALFAIIALVITATIGTWAVQQSRTNSYFKSAIGDPETVSNQKRLNEILAGHTLYAEPVMFPYAYNAQYVQIYGDLSGMVPDYGGAEYYFSDMRNPNGGHIPLMVFSFDNGLLGLFKVVKKS